MTLQPIVDRAFEPVRGAIAERCIPGAVLGLVDAAGDRVVAFSGQAQIQPTAIAMRRETVFDLASLTKVIFTTTTILRLVEQGRVALDQPLSELIPDLRQYDLDAAERTLTVRQLLAHQTFLPAVEPLYTYGQDPQTLRAFVLQRVWKHGPPVYSDINFLLLGLAIERVTGAPLKSYPLHAGFTFAPDASACAATEYCHWRERMLRGEVHDENAFALGGASGHAGLFGAIDAVLDFAASMLNNTALQPDTISLLRTRQSPQRTLGWEMKYDGWSGGAACSEETIGHTGFTGTGLWIDFPRRIAWSLLTNRVHPTRHVETGIAQLRQAVGRLAGDFSPATRQGVDAKRSVRKSRNTRTLGSR
ncbi:serine hydrolase domain-containing protein [Bradyrhizobium sp. LHD-71]|uniref:serine hydrolase domain-containing protein n=1 Tax=Bradyrhizobium sp. LHD-71 TaxID=3072141 RepID=UPI00280ECCB2|nr:serine hydrolase domain-containing protein [Bradyrhizobium sp. LHD-71]MDQ8731782.1 serine hydrolase domain-containing protein [Bradyrhizobium sp. LHD-71]